jgi:hypothetical protein
LAIGPDWLVSPTRVQESSDLQLSYTLSKWAPILTVVNLLFAIPLAIAVWRTGRLRLRKLGVALSLVAIAFCIRTAQQPVVEGIFSPLPEAVYVPVPAAVHVQDDDHVLGIRFAGRAVAYPVPIVAYHHIVNDRLDDEPFVVTY